MALVIAAITEGRSVRSPNVPPAALARRCWSPRRLPRRILEANTAAIAQLLRIEGLRFEPASDGASPTSRAAFALPVADYIDLAAERVRLSKELAALAGDIDRTAKKLATPTSWPAPEEVVDENRERLADAEAARDRLGAALKRLKRSGASLGRSPSEQPARVRRQPPTEHHGCNPQSRRRGSSRGALATSHARAPRRRLHSDQRRGASRGWSSTDGLFAVTSWIPPAGRARPSAPRPPARSAGSAPCRRPAPRRRPAPASEQEARCSPRETPAARPGRRPRPPSADATARAPRRSAG